MANHFKNFRKNTPKPELTPEDIQKYLNFNKNTNSVHLHPEWAEKRQKPNDDSDDTDGVESDE